MVGVSIISGMKCVNIPSVDGKASLLVPDVVTDKIYSEISVQKIVQIKNRQKRGRLLCIRVELCYYKKVVYNSDISQIYFT